MVNTFPSIKHLLAHRKQMILIDELLSANDNEVTAVTHHRNALAYESRNGFLPSYICLEYMAQTVAAFAGLRTHNADGKAGIGFLLGTRAFEAIDAEISSRQALKIHAKEIINEEDNIALFQCEVTELLTSPQPENELKLMRQAKSSFIATATIKVFQPQDIDNYLSREGNI